MSSTARDDWIFWSVRIREYRTNIGYHDRRARSRGLPDQLHPNVFYEESTVRDYPIKGRNMIFHVKLCRWVETATGKSVSKHWDIVADGIRFSKEFAAFFNGMLVQIPDYGPLSWMVFRYRRRFIRATIQAISERILAVERHRWGQACRAVAYLSG